jgi:rubrerythrin
MNITRFDPDLMHLELLGDDERGYDFLDSDLLLELKRFSSDHGVLSVYADLGEGAAAALTRYRNQVKALRDAHEREWDHERRQQFDALTGEVAERLEKLFREPRGKGVALFVAPGRLLVKKGKLDHELLRVFHLPEAPRDEVRWGNTPALTQILLQQDEHPPTGVVLFDREKLRFFLYYMGEAAEYSVRLDNPDAVPLTKAHSWHGYGTHNHHQWQEEHYQRYLRQAALAVAKLADKAGWKWLALASPDAQEAVHLGEQLPSAWSGQLIGTLSLPMASSLNEIRDAVAPLVATREKQEEKALLDDWISELERPDGRAVAGLADTAEAVQEYRVLHFIADSDFHHAGWQCSDCGSLMADLQEAPPAACPYCSSTRLEQRADIVGDLALQVINSGGHAEIVRDEANRERVGNHGLIGGLLRY